MPRRKKPLWMKEIEAAAREAGIDNLPLCDSEDEDSCPVGLIVGFGPGLQPPLENQRLFNVRYNDDKEPVTPPEEWRTYFQVFISHLVSHYPISVALIMVFKAGQIYEKYHVELNDGLRGGDVNR